MSRPDGSVVLPIVCDLTYCALEAASNLLPAAKHYRLVVHPEMLRRANEIIGLHADVIASNPLSPGMELVVDELITDLNEWRLEAAGQVFWSPGG